MATTSLLTTRWGPILTGAAIGVCAPLLVKLGNPGNMGVCVACFSRDIAGALGLHRAAPVQYLRPEISGLVLGALLAALLHREFRPRTGSAPLVRFVLGICAVAGALMFLGCPWRAYLRLAGGDGNAMAGIGGLAAGIALGVLFLRRGFSLGRTRPAPVAVGWIIPALMLGLLALLLWAPQVGRTPEGTPTGPVFFSTQGPGSQHAPILVAFVLALGMGYLAQRSRFCTVGAIRDLILMRDAHLFNGVLAVIGAALVTNVALGLFKPGFTAQPIAHTNTLWNFLGMTLSGLAFTLAGGCPGRQLFLAGEGDADAGMFALGVLVGAGIVHTFNAASSAAGPGPTGPAFVIAGLVVSVMIGLTMRDPQR